MDTVFYRGSTATSPHRQESKSHGGLTATRMKTKELAQDVQDAVEQDFSLHYRVTDTEEFLNRLLHVDETILNTILEYMKKEEFYNSETQRWKGFPDPKATRQDKGSKKKKKPKENTMYGPFCAIAEAIRGFVEKQCLSVRDMGSTKWMDYHSNSPLSPNTQAAKLRPDALFALQAIAHQTVLKESQQGQQEGGREDAEEKELGEETEEEEEEEGGSGEEAAEPRPEVEEVEGQKKEKDILQLIWWLQIIAAVEMKRTNQKWYEVIKQLVGYLRRILREQLDRRFVFGLVLGPDKMSVWLHDRSGVIGTKLPIDIHKEPLKFIQVIASFSLLAPELLGFDPTIEMLVSRTQAVPSYKPNEEFLRAYQAAPHNRNWVIRMNDGSKYMTLETISYIRAGFMRGRGGVVWVVVPLDGATEEAKVFVLKQSWRPCEVQSEGDLYDKAECDHVGKIERCEEVLISDKRDATDTLIRKSLDDLTGLGKRPRDESQEGKDPYIHTTFTDPDDIKEVLARATGPPSPRVRTRVLLSTYGWLIKYFSTRRELLVVLRDAIRGHKYLYERGVLHRDISPGNVLIQWRPGSEANRTSTSGCLIDLDHAKKGKTSSEGVTASSVDDDLDDLVLLWCSKKSVETDVARRAFEFFLKTPNNIGPTLTYVGAALEHALNFRSFNGQLCTLQHLGWKPVKVLYNFEFHPTERYKGSRTGTPPYTSGEILSGRRYFPGHKDVFHDAVHDLESFFWVLVHICITRQGPGGVRREELEDKNQAKEEYNGLRRVVHCFFDSNVVRMANNKAEIFTHPNEFEQYVLDNFHGYFQPLKGVIKEWYHLLILAHQFHAFEYYHIHDMVLGILDRALGSAPPDIINEEGQKALDDRKANIDKLLDGNPYGKVQPSPPPHTSPTSERQVASPVFRSPPSSPTPMPKRGKTRHARM